LPLGTDGAEVVCVVGADWTGATVDCTEEVVVEVVDVVVALVLATGVVSGDAAAGGGAGAGAGGGGAGAGKATGLTGFTGLDMFVGFVGLFTQVSVVVNQSPHAGSLYGVEQVDILF